MISPITVVLVAASIGVAITAGAPWFGAVAAGLAVWGGRVLIARGVAKRIKQLPQRVDPFALREPWRFFVRDALSAHRRFSEAIASASVGPLRDRLTEIGAELDRGVAQCWEAAQHGQRLTDARRSIDGERLVRRRDALDPGDDLIPSLDAQIAGHTRLAQREESVRADLDRLSVRLDEAVARAAELVTRTGALAELDEAGSSIQQTVRELEALRAGLDDVEGES